MAIQSVGTNLCCCNIDGMDQSKFKIPRVATRISGSTSKLFQRLFRPTLHVSGAWCHGHILNFWVADGDLRKDSSTQQEILSRTLSDIYNKHGCLPMGLICQQDNTYREERIVFFVGHMVLLVALRCFCFCVRSYLRVGHSFSVTMSNYVVFEQMFKCLKLVFPRCQRIKSRS